MKKILCFVFSILLICQPVLSAPVSTVVAPTYFLADLKNGNILVKENCTTNIMPNEFSKIMTAILALETFQADEIIPFTDDSLIFYNNFGNIANIKTGKAYTLYEHLQNMLLLYSDGSANALAIAHSGNTEDFVAKMNEKAQQLGMNETVFSSPSGNDKHNISKTTISDLVILYKTALGNEIFSEIMAMDTIKLPSGNNLKMFSSRNHLISRYTYSTYVYSAARSGMVTFSRDTASLIATAARGNKELLAIVVNSPDTNNMTVYKDMINLFEHGFNNYYYQPISKEGEIIHQVTVLGGKSDHATLISEFTQNALVPYSYSESKLEKKISAPENIWAPVKKGEPIGTVSYYYDGKEVTTVNLIADEDVKFSLLATIERVILSRINSIFLFILILIVVLILVLSFRSNKKQEDRKRRKREISQNKK